jgi:hypothetical protein
MSKQPCPFDQIDQLGPALERFEQQMSDGDRNPSASELAAIGEAAAALRRALADAYQEPTGRFEAPYVPIRLGARGLGVL